MKKVNWIWSDRHYAPDEHVDFRSFYKVEKRERIFLNLSCDTIYSIKINGEHVGFGQMYDYEDYKTLDCYDISRYCRVGENQIDIHIWFWGEETLNYRKSSAGLYFEITENGKTIAASDEEVLCKYSESYKQHKRQMITSAQGYTFWYDNTTEALPFVQKSVIVEKKVVFAPEKVKNLIIKEIIKGRTVLKSEKRCIIDIGKECFGFISFRIKSGENENHIRFSYGEHIENGHVYTCKSFYHRIDYTAKQGVNEHYDYLRPIGCRFFEVESDFPIEIEWLGVSSMQYPFTQKAFLPDNELDAKIYNTCVYTLLCCTAKHYYDCPWREQSMYIQDSRNQMLCGYYAFDNPELIKYNIIFLSKGMSQYKVLVSCPPTRVNNLIPFFSLVYVFQVYEYMQRTGDTDTLKEVVGSIDCFMNFFISRINEGKGLISQFPYPYWNFYEWNENSANWPPPCESDTAQSERFDTIFNAAFALAVDRYREMLHALGKDLDFDNEAFKRRIKKHLWSEKNHYFYDDTRKKSASKMANGIAILAGILSEEENAALAEQITNSKELTDVSLAGVTFVYDALLKVDKKYSEFILKDIRKKYSFMLEKGATTFWETIDGHDDFGGSGSLCHGWSAVPIYYYHILQKKE